MTSSRIETSAGERRVFAALAVAYVVMTAAVAPWAGLPGPRVPQIVLVSNGGVALADFCTALVLGRAFRRGGEQAYLVLTLAYLLGAVMALAQLAAFPGALLDPPLVAAEQAAAWLFCVWRWALALLFLVTVLRARAAPLEPTRRSGALARAMLLAIAACGAFVAVSSTVDVPLVTQERFTTANAVALAASLLVFCSALLLIWRRRSFEDPLYLWLALVLVTWVVDELLVLLAGGRYTIGWHVVKIANVISACLLLVLWLGHLREPDRHSRVTSIAGYGAATSVMLAALLLRWLALPWVGGAFPFATVFGAVAIAVWIGGWRPAALAALVGFFGATLFFAGPLGTLPVSGVAQAAGSVMFAGSCALIIGLGEAMRRVRDQYRAAEERFRQSQEASLQGYVILTAIRDADGAISDFRIDYVNPRGAALANEDAARLVGRRMLEVAPTARTAGIFEMCVHTVESGEPCDREVRYDSRAFSGWFHTLIVKVGDGVALSFSDITETKRLESDLIQRASDLQRADANKSQFLAVLSHELRNPLAPLVTGLRLLGMLQEPKALADTRAMMERQINHMRRLIDDLLDVSRIDRGKLELVRGRVAVDTVVRSAIETAKPAIEAKQHELVVHYAPEPLYVEGDATRLAQIVANLLNNAAKYTPQHGRIEVALASDAGTATVTVRDNGIGFMPGDEERIFEMFVQLGDNRTPESGGLGLGLTLSRRLAEMHGGSLRARSSGPDRGAEFVLRIPLARAAPAETAPIAPPLRTRSDRRVLVVDDNVDARDSLSLLLELEGFEVRACEDGVQALVVAREFKPHVAFIDLNMPRMGGVELGQKVRAEPWARALRLVALTGMGQQSDVEATRAAGFDAHLTKPASLEQVLQLAATPTDNVVTLRPLESRRGF